MIANEQSASRKVRWTRHLWWLIPLVLVAGCVIALQLYADASSNHQGYTLF